MQQLHGNNGDPNGACTIYIVWEQVQWVMKQKQHDQVSVILWHHIQAHKIIEKSKDSNDLFVEL